VYSGVSKIHLKSLVDSYSTYQFIATGSAAAVLKLKSKESGAGRFTDFLLPQILDEFPILVNIEFHQK
jgi:predicted AAA+ superfamily ATPase